MPSSDELGDTAPHGIFTSMARLVAVFEAAITTVVLMMALPIAAPRGIGGCVVVELYCQMQWRAVVMPQLA